MPDGLVALDPAFDFAAAKAAIGVGKRKTRNEPSPIACSGKPSLVEVPVKLDEAHICELSIELSAAHSVVEGCARLAP